MEYLIEACVTSVASAVEAQKGGAKRVELCDNIYEGGTTPSFATIEMARKVLEIELNVMIRPRGQDFCYSKHEIEIMKRDIEICKSLGVDGVVLGVLNKDGTVNIDTTKELTDIASPMSVTFHRAFDMTPEPFEALKDILLTGANRILTSGQENKAIDGLKLIKQLIEQAAGRIIIMPGSGINDENISIIKNETGAKEFHLSASKYVDSIMAFRKDNIYMGGLPQIPEYQIRITDAGKIKRIVRKIEE